MSLSRGQRKTEDFSMSISDHADFCAIAAARAARCFTMVSIFERSPLFLSSRRFVVTLMLVPSRKVIPSATPCWS